MTKYKFTLCGTSFHADTDEEFIEGLRSNHGSPMKDDRDMMRLLAATYCESRGKSFRFSDVSSFREDCLNHGVLEVIDARA